MVCLHWSMWIRFVKLVWLASIEGHLFLSKHQDVLQKTLELLHGDLCGPVSPPTPIGNKYFLLLVDDYSRYMWISIIASKDQATSEIKRI
jgi:hypothetical protein